MKTQQIDAVGAMSQEEFDQTILPVLMSIDKWKLPDCIRKMEEAVAKLLGDKRKLKRREKSDRRAESRREGRQRRRTEKQLEAAGERTTRNKMTAAEYQAYLQSPKWQQIRQVVMMRDGGRCQTCGREATQVHHRRYDKRTMEGETTEWLIALCGGCHRAIHFRDGKRLRPKRVELFLQTMLLWASERMKQKQQ